MILYCKKSALLLCTALSMEVYLSVIWDLRTVDDLSTYLKSDYVLEIIWMLMVMMKYNIKQKLHRSIIKNFNWITPNLRKSILISFWHSLQLNMFFEYLDFLAFTESLLFPCVKKWFVLFHIILFLFGFFPLSYSSCYLKLLLFTNNVIILTCVSNSVHWSFI